MTILYELLGIPDDGGPVHAYRLLGLEPLEPDPHTIAEAVARSRERLEAQAEGPLAEPCRRYLAVVDQAEAILTDPSRKRRYDETLAAKLPPARRTRRRLPLLGWLRELEAGQRVKLAVAAACLAGCAGVGARALLAAPRFPRPHSGFVSRAERDHPMPVLPPPPFFPSVPGLKVGEPRRVPGLEGLPEGYSPSLTADLKTIAFAAYTGGKSKHDLFLARRDDVRARFGAPRRVDRCSGAATEATPTLSPDGLELAFARYGPGRDEGRVFLARRASADAEFGEPEPIALPDFPAAEYRADRPVFFNDGLSLAVKVVRPPSKGREDHRLVVLERTSRDGPFEPAVPLAIQNPWATTALSADGLRAYQSDDKGIKVACRPALGIPFGGAGAVQTLLAAGTGPVDGPFFVVPGDDVVFYCSPGPGKPPGAVRSLWMIRIH